MKALAVLKLPKPAKKVSVLARSIVVAMANEPAFASPAPSLATLTAAIAALEAADAIVLMRTKGAREARDATLAALRLELIHLAAYVQEIADKDPSSAAAIIEAAGMRVKNPSPRNKIPFQAMDGTVSGSARLVAKSAGDRAAYEWQYGTDGRTWNRAPMTLQASTVLFGLTPGTTYSFRLRVVTKEGEASWSDVLSLVVK
jgi:hypothetical protein